MTLSIVELEQRMAPACREAVDPMELAAVLEADGVTDAVAARRYAATDVFDLAERLYRQVPRQPATRPVTASPWRSPAGRHLLRGALFVLPALFYLTLAGTSGGPRVGVLLLVSLLLSWSTSQAMAYLGHVRRGRQDEPGAARLLRGGLLWAGGVVTAITALVAVQLQVPRPVALLAVGQVGYLLAATVALVFGAERLLLLALSPGVVASLAGLALGGSAVRAAPVLAGTAATVAGTVALALWCTRGARSGRPLSRTELVDALPHAAFGLLAGGLLAFVPTAGTAIPGARAAGGTLVGVSAVLPLTVSMGVAEWLVYRYRAATYRALQRTHTLHDFAHQASAALLRAMAGYLLALAAISGAAAGAASVVTGTALPIRPMLGYLALGGALFVALLLMSYGARCAVVLGCAAALFIEYAVTARWLPIRGPVDVHAVQLATAVGLLTVLLSYALVALSGAARHR